MTSYEWWEKALSGVKVGSPELPVHDSDPQPGFYRKRVQRAGAYVPVAIWEDNGQIIALADGREVDAAEVWSFCCRYPISEGWYRAKMAGQAWPDEDCAVARSLAPPPAGHNHPPTDPKILLREQIDACLAAVADYGRVESDEVASKAQGLRSRLLELSNQADKERERQVRPLLDSQKAVNGDFMPLVRDAKGGADILRQAISAHETRQYQARQKAEREAEVERQRLEALNASPVSGPDAVLPVEVPKPQPAPPVEATIRGAYGRGASKKLVKKAKITDYGKAVVALKDHPEMKELVAKLAQRAVDAGAKVDGVEFEEVIDVR